MSEKNFFQMIVATIKATGFILLQLVLLCSLAFATSALQQKTQELNQVKQQIQGVQTNLEEAESQREQLLPQLKTIELAISQSSNELSTTTHHLNQQTQILSDLKQHEQQYAEQLQQQQSLLGQQMRTQYILGQHQYIKLLLNQQNPNNLSRFMQYYYYITKERLEIIQQLNATLQKIATNEQQIQLHTLALQQLVTQQSTEKTKLQQQLQTRESVLQQINATIKTKSDRLKMLQTNQATITNLIEKLKHVSAEEIPTPKVPFAQLQGKLHWPTTGKITEHFGVPIDTSGLTYEGILIAAPSGQAIHAVSAGKVVFADWLRGLGLLIIVEHDHGFMTLYGHNHSINVHVGDNVTAGEVIGTVGKSGGAADSGLYFEIRDNGKPLNPMQWLAN